MKTCGYVRVSGAGQVEKDGPERQTKAIQDFCSQYNLPPGEIFFEEGVSGTVEAVDRPEFSRLLESVQAGDCIVVERMDRLARDLMVQEFLLKECRERHLAVYCADQGALIDMASDGGDPTRKLIRQVLGALAEWEKSALVLKLRKARDRKRAQTGRCEGPLPYGSTPQEKIVLETARNLRQKGYTYDEIAEALRNTPFLPRFGGQWQRSTVRHILLR